MTSSSTLLFILLLLAIAMTLQAKPSPGRRKTACHRIMKLSKSVWNNIKKNTKYCGDMTTYDCLDSLPEVRINCQHDWTDLCKQVLINYEIVLKHLKEKSNQPPIIQGQRNTKLGKNKCNISCNINKLHRKIRQKVTSSGDTRNKKFCPSSQNCTATPNMENVNCQSMDWKCIAESVLKKLNYFLQDFKVGFRRCNRRKRVTGMDRQ